MSLATEIYQEIRVLTQHFTEASVCLENRFPALRAGPGGFVELYPMDSSDISATLKNVRYWEAYNLLRKAKGYNMILLDGAMIQLRYIINPAKKEITKHCIGYWPSPRLLPLEQAEWLYDEDEPFGDAIDERGVLPVPVRIDFAPEQFVEHTHPKCHATFGQFPNCRIAVAGPVRPGLFLDFVLRNFYQRELASFGSHYPFPFYDSACSITEAEGLESMHFMIPRLLPRVPMIPIKKRK